MAKSNKYWDDRAIRRLTDAEKQSEKYIARINSMYDRASKNIQRDIEDVYRNYSTATGLDVQSLKELLTASETEKLWAEMRRKGLDKYVKGNYKARISRLEKIQAQIYAKAKELYPEEEQQHTMCYEGVINKSYYKAIYDTQMGTGFDFAFSKIDDNMVKALMSERWSGKNYSQRIWGNTDILAESLSELIGGAMLSGQSIEKTTRQIRERFGVAKHYAERLVRTETNHFNNEADAMAYEEMDVDKYVFLATLDTRTSTICQRLDNKVFPLSERKEGVNYPPMHPNCRSKTRAYMGEEIEATLKRRARNPVTGKNEIIGNVSYEEWAKLKGLDKPEAAQKNKSKSPLIKSSKRGRMSANNYGFRSIRGKHTIDKDVSSGGVPTCNPKFGTGSEYEDNCQRCVQAFEFRRRGMDVVAKPKPANGNAIVWGNECFVDANGNPPQYTLRQTKKQVFDELNGAPDGARYSIYVAWKQGRAHVFAAEKVNGVVRFIDPQTGNVDASSYFGDGKEGRFGFLRMDDKQLTPHTQIVDATMEGRK